MWNAVSGNQEDSWFFQYRYNTCFNAPGPIDCHYNPWKFTEVCPVQLITWQLLKISYCVCVCMCAFVKHVYIDTRTWKTAMEKGI